jgi:hypothetical protein
MSSDTSLCIQESIFAKRVGGDEQSLSTGNGATSNACPLAPKGMVLIAVARNMCDTAVIKRETQLLLLKLSIGCGYPIDTARGITGTTIGDNAAHPSRRLLPQSRDAGSGGSRARKPYPRQLRHFRECVEPRVGNIGSIEIESLEMPQYEKMSHSGIGNLGLGEPQYLELRYLPQMLKPSIGEKRARDAQLLKVW